MTSDILMAYWPILLGGLLVLVALVTLLLVRRRGQRVELGQIDPVIAPTLTRAVAIDPVAAAPKAPVPIPVTAGAPDDLRRIKGLGPKVAAKLGAIGITRFDQLAALDAEGQAALDAQLGAFAGRMARDRWIEQASLLAQDDIAAFEAQFGKIG